MSPVYSGDLDTAPAEEGLSTLPTSLGASLGATAHRAWSEGWTPEIADISGAEAAKGHMPSLGDFEAPLMNVPEALTKSIADQPEISTDAARQRVKESGLPIELPDRPTIKQGYLDLLLNRAREKREDEATIARGPSGFLPGALSVGTSFAVGAVDPVNAAAMFLPVVGEARYGKLLGSAADTIMGRAAVRAAAGTETGAYLGAAKVPLDLAAAGEDGRDYGYVDALQSIIESAGTFGLMHGAFGLAGDVYRTLRGRPLEPLGAGGEPTTPETAVATSPMDRAGNRYERAPPTTGEGAPEAQPSSPAGREVSEPLTRAGPELGAEPVTAEQTLAPVRSISAEENPIGEVLRTVDVQPALSAIDGLPPQAKRDLMQGTVAALTQDKPAPAMEMLRAGADGDPRIAEAVHQIGDSASGKVTPDEAWRALAETKPPESEPDAVAAFRRAENLEPPTSVEASTEPEGEPRPLRPMESRSSGAEAGGRPVEGAEPEAPRVAETGARPEGGAEPEAPRRTSPATRAALEADRRAAVDFELQAAGMTDAERAQIDDVLRQIDLEESDWRSLVDAGAACLATAVGA
jgi:hypothetical protein